MFIGFVDAKNLLNIHIVLFLNVSQVKRWQNRGVSLWRTFLPLPISLQRIRINRICPSCSWTHLKDLIVGVVKRPEQQQSEKIRNSLQVRDTNTPFLHVPFSLSVRLRLLTFLFRLASSAVRDVHRSPQMHQTKVTTLFLKREQENSERLCNFPPLI